MNFFACRAVSFIRLKLPEIIFVYFKKTIHLRSFSNHDSSHIIFFDKLLTNN